MPSLDQILGQTMLGLADPYFFKNPLGRTASVSAASPEEPYKRPANMVLPFEPPNLEPFYPRQDVVRDADGWVWAPDAMQRRFVPVWSWEHDGSKPNSVTGIKSRVLGMGMDYRMAMSVCNEITLDDVSITLPGSDVSRTLPLDSSFVLRKYKSEGVIRAGVSQLFPLQLVLDQSLLVVFGYRLTAGKFVPLTEAEVTDLNFMPVPTGSGNIPCQVGNTQPCIVREYRLIVCFSITCCKENNDFEPGGVLGANRIFPHAMIMPNLPLKEIQAAIRVVRPATSNHRSEDMHTDIHPILFTDTNLPPRQIVGPGLPLWDNMFDYYETDPLTNIHVPLHVVDSDPNSPRAKKRTRKGVVTKLGTASSTPHDPDDPTPVLQPVIPAAYESRDLVKMPRQGDFDNMHMAPRMKIPSTATLTADVIAQWRLDPVAMAPFCVHDCLHTHVRWGMEASIFWRASMVASLPPSAKGFNNNFQPYCVEGGPQVPHNQSVTWTLLPPAGFTYRGTVQFAIAPGNWQVVFHHGMAYANEIWADFLVSQARGAVDMYATYQMEEQFPPLNANQSWAFFYWRLRYGGTAMGTSLAAPMERVSSKISDCMSL